MCGTCSAREKSNIILLRISTALLHLKCCSAELLLRVWAHKRYIDLSGIYASSLHVLAPPLMEVLRYSTSNAVTQSKYVME